MKKLYKSLKNFCFSSIPVMTVFLSVFITILPYKADYLSLLMPLLTPITIYFWSVYQPQHLSYISVFLLSIFKDIMEDNVIGISTICFLLFQAMIRFQRKCIINNAFIVVWAGFIFFLSIILLIPLILVHFSIDTQNYKFTIIFSQWLITIFVYVPIHWLLSKLDNLKLQ